MTYDMTQFRDASFRGVKFHVKSSQRSSGHRLDKKSYPFRNGSEIHDMGRDSAVFELQVYVIGPDTYQRRKALETAFEQTGAGELIHPTRGKLQVMVRSLRESEQFDDLFVADFSVTFEEPGLLTGPVAVADSQAAVRESAAACDAALLDHCGLDWLNDEAEVAATITQAEVWTDALNKAATRLGNATPSALFQSSEIGQQIRAAVDEYLPVGEAAWRVAQAAVNVGRQWADLGGAISSGNLGFLLSVMGLGGVRSLAANFMATGAQAEALIMRVSGDSGSRVWSGATGYGMAPDNAVVLAGLFDAGIALAAAETANETLFTDTRAAITTRDSLTGFFNSAALSASSLADPLAVAEIRAAFRGLSINVWRDLSARAAALPVMRAVEPLSVQPARLHAWRLEQSSDVAGFVARNGIEHPAFVPAGEPLLFKEGRG